MRKGMIKRFTLVELLVVISIIAILAGILMPQLGKAQDAANRTANNSAVRSITQACAAGLAMTRGGTIRGDWATSFTTVTGNVLNGEANNGSVNAGWNDASSDNIYIIELTGQTPAMIGAMQDAAVGAAPSGNTGSETFASLKAFRANHALDPDYGYYIYMGQRWMTGSSGPSGTTYQADTSLQKTKKRNDTATRIVGEYYTPQTADGMSAVGFSDTHVSNMKNFSGSANIMSFEPDVLNAKDDPQLAEAIE